MYKIKQKILFVFFTMIMVAILIVPNKSFSATTINDYTIQAYNINMVVNEDNTFDITERITANFNIPKHGIYRKIPLKNSIKRTDGTKSNNIAKISDISVSEDYTTSNENGYKVIKIGNANRTFNGTHAYTIKYKYDIGKDPIKNADELYFNLIGSEWDAPIDNVSFNITMPKTFDESKLGFSSGNVGSTNSSDITYNVNGNTITGNLTNTLMPGQALTVRLTLPEGYFAKAKSNFDMFPIIVMIICVIFVLIADKLWRKYGKDNKVIETVEFYPPEGLNSAEVAYLYKGENSNEGVVSLLIYLADKGYIKIEEEKDKFVIKKLKEYRGNNECESLFFHGLFEKGISKF